MKRSLVFFSAALISGGALALDAFTCPFPLGMQASLGVPNEAIKARDSGVPKEALLARIPQQNASNKWLVFLMKQITDEVFDFSPLDTATYGAYRGELCFMAQKYPERKISGNYVVAHPKLLACASKSVDEDKIKCAMGVVHSIENVKEE